MRKEYEPGLDYDLQATPITMWLSTDLLPKVRTIFKSNYGLPFVSEGICSATGFSEYEVTMKRDVDAHVFWEHLTTVPPGGYALLPDR